MPVRGSCKIEGRGRREGGGGEGRGGGGGGEGEDEGRGEREEMLQRRYCERGGGKSYKQKEGKG